MGSFIFLSARLRGNPPLIRSKISHSRSVRRHLVGADARGVSARGGRESSGRRSIRLVDPRIDSARLENSRKDEQFIHEQNWQKI
jgi:hypothetical protein